jgi:hypothetical protein
MALFHLLFAKRIAGKEQMYIDPAYTEPIQTLLL